MKKFCGRGSKSCVLIEKLVKVDRISELPEELLIYILSFLPPKFACTTSVLSKRWKLLCQFLSVLRFDDKSVKNEEEFTLFNMFIDKVMLSKDRQQPIKVFHLRCHSPLSLINHDEWVEAAKRRGIEDLQLSMFQFVTVYKMNLSCSNSMMDEEFITISPNNVFSCRTLVILKLKRLCVVGNILSIDLPSLKILHLKGVYLQSSEDLKKLISASLVLEDLYILVGYRENASIPLTRVGLGLSPYHVLFKAIYYSVQFLLLEARLPNEKIISYFKGSPVFRNLIHIELVFYHFYGWDDVLNVLHHCPNLHIFSIHKVTLIPSIISGAWFRNWETTLSTDGKLFTNWKCPNSVPKCISYHLRSCTVTYDGKMDSLRFAAYILQNAPLLQVMTVKITNLTNSIYDWVFLDELSSSPKISPICEISIVQT